MKSKSIFGLIILTIIVIVGIVFGVISCKFFMKKANVIEINNISSVSISEMQVEFRGNVEKQVSATEVIEIPEGFSGSIRLMLNSKKKRESYYISGYYESIMRAAFRCTVADSQVKNTRLEVNCLSHLVL